MKELQFETVRVAALNRWLTESGRVRGDQWCDTIAGTVECRMQNALEDKHNAFFCGLAEWMCHLTDMLSDQYYDKIFSSDLEYPPDVSGDVGYDNDVCLALARYYGRVLIIVSEFIGDVYGLDKKKVKSGEDLKKFVNHVVKHKSKTFHARNHHLPIYFTDFTGEYPESALTIGKSGDFDEIEYDAIVYPTLDEILNTVFEFYNRLKEIYKDKPPDFWNKYTL